MRAFGLILISVFSASMAVGENPSSAWTMVWWRTAGNQTQLQIAIRTASRSCDSQGDSYITVMTKWPLVEGEELHSVPLDRPIHVETGKNGTVSMFYGDAGELAESADVTFRSVRDSHISGDYVVKLKSGVQHRGPLVGKQCTQADGELVVRLRANPRPTWLSMHVLGTIEPVHFALGVDAPVRLRLSAGQYTVAVTGGVGTCGYRPWHKKVRIRPGRTTAVLATPNYLEGVVCE